MSAFPVVVVSFRPRSEVYTSRYNDHECTVYERLCIRHIEDENELVRHIVKLDAEAQDEHVKLYNMDKHYPYRHIILTKDAFKFHDFKVHESEDASGGITFPDSWEQENPELWSSDYQDRILALVEAAKKEMSLEQLAAEKKRQEQEAIKQKEIERQRAALAAIEQERKERAELARLKSKYEVQ